MGLDRRLYPRIETDLPLTIFVADGAQHAGVICNVSRAGLQIGCDRWTATHIVPGTFQAVPGDPLEIDIQFQLPVPGEPPCDVRTRCKVVGATRLAQNVYRVSVQYLDLDDRICEKLDKFVNEMSLTVS